METTRDANMAPTIKMNLGQVDNNLSQAMYTRNMNPNGNGQDEFPEPAPIGPLKAKVHACQASQRFLQQASDRLIRANRDLGETAAFVAASLTTVTAIEAVMNISTSKLEIPIATLQFGFKLFTAILLGILVWGLLRARRAVQLRRQAEKDIDQAKKGIFKYCPTDQWPEVEG